MFAQLGQVLDFAIAAFAAMDGDYHAFHLQNGATWIIVARAVAGICASGLLRATQGDPLDALILKIPLSFSAEFWVRVTSGARGVSVGRILGGLSIEPFLGGRGGGGGLARGLC